MYTSIVTAYKQNKNETLKVKVHLQKTNYHTKPKFSEIFFFLFEQFTIFLPNVLAHLSLNHMAELGGYELTLEGDMRNRIKGRFLFLSPLGWVGMSCSQWTRQKQCL